MTAHWLDWLPVGLPYIFGYSGFQTRFSHAFAMSLNSNAVDLGNRKNYLSQLLCIGRLLCELHKQILLINNDFRFGWIHRLLFNGVIWYWPNCAFFAYCAFSASSSAISALSLLFWVSAAKRKTKIRNQFFPYVTSLVSSCEVCQSYRSSCVGY